MADAVDPALAREYVPLYRKALSGEPFVHEHQAHGRHYLTRGVPLRNRHGRVDAALAISYDVTDRKHADNAIRDSELRLRTLADAVPQIIWTNDSRGYADYFNRRWYDFTGLSFEESAGRGGRRSSIPRMRPHRSSGGAKRGKPARYSTRSIACAAPTAGTAGSSDATFRCAMCTATSAAGSAPRPTSTT